jgi:hypothetical protein
MALIRGVGSLAPCPRCLVLESNLWNPDIYSTPRTSDTMQAIQKEANQKRTATEKEVVLKAVGLRDVDEVFFLQLYQTSTLS